MNSYVLMDSVFTRLSHHGHSRTLCLRSGLFRLRMTFRVGASSRLRRINASFRALVPSLTRPLVLKLQEFVITDLKPRLARYKHKSAYIKVGLFLNLDTAAAWMC
jgi:hypothetical protein